MNSQDIMSHTKSTCSIEVFSDEDYLNKSKDTEFKRTTISVIKEFKESKEEKKKHIFEFLRKQQQTSE